MFGADSPGIAHTEVARWVRDPVVLTTIGALIVLSGGLTYLAVVVATGSTSSGGSGVRLQADTVITSESTGDDLASMARSSLAMLVPIAAIVLGVQFAGSELRSGALLQLGVVARRLRHLFAVRVSVLVVLAGLAGAGAAALALASTRAAVAHTSELSHLSVSAGVWPMIAGAAAQALVVALIAFGLAALTRRWVVVTISMLVYLVALEPTLSSLVGEAGVWLPGAATSELMLEQPDVAHVLPTVICALLLVAAAVTSLHRDRAAQ